MDQKVLENYWDACRSVGEAFIEKYFEKDAEYFCVSNDPSVGWYICGYHFSLRDMTQALKNNIPKKIVFSWYDHVLESVATGNTYANLENYYKLTTSTL